MSTPAIEHHSFRIPLECRYLLELPASPQPNPILALALHGYGMNAAVMLRLTRNLLGPVPIIASIQAPNEFYLNIDSPSQSITGYNWGTRAHWRSAVSTHHEITRSVLASLRARFSIPPARCLLTAFSQPVGLNYRFAATFPSEVAALIAVCGGLPRDWDDNAYQPVSASILHIARDRDHYYPPEIAAQFPQRLRLRAAHVDFHMIPGEHRFPSQAAKIVQPWLSRIFPE